MAAPAIFSYPTTQDVREMEQQRLPQVMASMPGERILPWTTENTDTVLWEIRDDITGLTYSRGANEPFPLVQDVPLRSYYISPGRYGERMEIEETKIERMRQPGTFGEPINVDAELARFQNTLAYREQQLIEYVRWRLLIFGSVSVLRKDGTPVEVGRYTVDQTTPPVPFTTLATASPLAFFDAIRNGYNGYGFQFDRNSVGFMNSNTAAVIKRNGNNADLYGVKRAGGATTHTMGEVNTIFGEENLPQLVENDLTYMLSPGSAPTRYIPDGYIVLVGYRPDRGIVAGNYVSTRNSNNPNGAPGLYVKTGERTEAPCLPWTERGHNGAPRIDYTRQVKVLKVY